jgi:hypothetical protein
MLAALITLKKKENVMPTAIMGPIQPKYWIKCTNIPIPTSRNIPLPRNG